MLNLQRKTLSLISILIISLTLIEYIPANAVSAVDLLPYIEGYTLYGDQYTYSEYVDYLVSIPANPSDFILGDDPEKVVLASYDNDGDYVWIEILEFSTEEKAQNEYRLQTEYDDFNGPIFQKFTPRERIFQYSNYLFIIFQSPLDSTSAWNKMTAITPTLISNFLDVLGSSPPPAPTTAKNAVWGVEPGDIITWHSKDNTFTGYVGGGNSANSGEFDGIWEIIDIMNGYLLIKESSNLNEIYTEDGNRVTFDVPYDKYTWYAPDDDGLVLRDSEGSPAGPVLFPLEYNGETLGEMAFSNVDHLPITSTDENTETLTVHGKTRSYSSFTPIETSWMDITVHRGTGIVTSYSFYYNNNEYSITTSVSVTMKSSSFTLSSRTVEIPTLSIEASLSPSELTQGTPLTLSAQVEDQNQNPVSDATVVATLDTYRYTLTSQGAGDYELSINTDSLPTGTHTINYSAEKENYQPDSDTETVTINAQTVSQPQQDDNPDTPTNTIPGYSETSIIIGLAIALILITYLRKH